jgi:hypothetical protein
LASGSGEGDTALYKLGMPYDLAASTAVGKWVEKGGNAIARGAAGGGRARKCVEGELDAASVGRGSAARVGTAEAEEVGG